MAMEEDFDSDWESDVCSEYEAELFRTPSELALIEELRNNVPVQRKLKTKLSDQAKAEIAERMKKMNAERRSSQLGWETPMSLKYLCCPVDEDVVVVNEIPESFQNPRRIKIPADEIPIQRPLRVGKICLEGCRYEIVRSIAIEVGFSETTPDDLWNIMWSDMPVCKEVPLGTEDEFFEDENLNLWRYHGDLHYQRVNHFPGSVEFCRKDCLTWNLDRLAELYPKNYNFYPKTWHLPQDYKKLEYYSSLNPEVVLICKPEAGAQGRGIFLSKNMLEIWSQEEQDLVVQQYIPNPILIDGYKFDLRIYVLITCVDPLRVYMYNEGLARFGTTTYNPPNEENLDNSFMHLTNYWVNKDSDFYDEDDDVDTGSKRKMSDVFQTMVEHGYDVIKLVRNIDEIVMKTIMTSHRSMKYYYKNTFPNYKRGSACFEIVGFDILLDKKMKPWLLEVNQSPSYVMDLVTDSEVKEQLLRDIFYMIHLGEEFTGEPPKPEDEEPKPPTKVKVSKPTPKSSSKVTIAKPTPKAPSKVAIAKPTPKAISKVTVAIPPPKTAPQPKSTATSLPKRPETSYGSKLTAVSSKPPAKAAMSKNTLTGAVSKKPLTGSVSNRSSTSAIPKPTAASMTNRSSTSTIPKPAAASMSKKLSTTSKPSKASVSSGPTTSSPPKIVAVSKRLQSASVSKQTPLTLASASKQTPLPLASASKKSPLASAPKGNQLTPAPKRLLTGATPISTRSKTAGASETPLNAASVSKRPLTVSASKLPTRSTSKGPVTAIAASKRQNKPSDPMPAATPVVKQAPTLAATPVLKQSVASKLKLKVTQDSKSSAPPVEQGAPMEPSPEQQTKPEPEVTSLEHPTSEPIPKPAEPKKAKPKLRDIAGKLITEELAAQFKYEEKNMNNFRLIYPMPGYTKYNKYFKVRMDNLYDKTPAFNLLEYSAEIRLKRLGRKPEVIPDKKLPDSEPLAATTSVSAPTIGDSASGPAAVVLAAGSASVPGALDSASRSVSAPAPLDLASEGESVQESLDLASEAASSSSSTSLASESASMSGSVDFASESAVPAS